MSTGVTGPIGVERLAEFAISRAFHVLKVARNKGTASCKICGARVTKGQGRAVRIADASAAGLTNNAFVCESCAGRIEAAASLFPSSKEPQ
jgi:hypothetical protein